jgi:putative pyruvate formate lyase activating enzyme
VADLGNRDDDFVAAYVALERTGKLARREQALWSMLEQCRLCPHECGVNRAAGESGVCRATDRLRVSSAMPHFGEEPPLVGTRGSGTIFFSHCNLRCCFCQNWEIAPPKIARPTPRAEWQEARDWAAAAGLSNLARE